MSVEVKGVRRLAGAACCVCNLDASACVHPDHRELNGVALVAVGKWICQACARGVAASWARAAKAAL